MLRYVYVVLAGWCFAGVMIGFGVEGPWWSWFLLGAGISFVAGAVTVK